MQQHEQTMEKGGTPRVEIAGAGPAGLSAAITIARLGQQACVFERKRDVGLRFHGDFQGLENWTTETDVLDELAAMGIEAGFDHHPFYELVGFDPKGQAHHYRSSKPLFYLVHRGSEAGSLDVALKQQALAAGAQIHFNQRAQHFPQGGIVTVGPHRADAIAAGYLFETDMADGAYAAVSDRLAPKGYAYLLVHAGRGTLATCMFDDFHNERQYVQRCVEFFQQQVGVQMKDPRRFGGTGNFALPRHAHKGNILYAGEAAGFQDPLFGFGMRRAMISGALAGAAIVAGEPERYERDWKRRLRNYQQTAATNRWFYDRLGDRGYLNVMGRLPEGADARAWLQRAYAPKLWKRAWYYLVARRRYAPLLADHEDCDCTWCRCARHGHDSTPLT